MAVDVSALAKLGKVAGVPGIALGVTAMVLGMIAEASGVLPEEWRGPVLIVIVLGAIGLGVLALLGWLCASAQVGHSEGADAPVNNTDKSKSTGSQVGTTKGDRSPVNNVRA